MNQRFNMIGLNYENWISLLITQLLNYKDTFTGYQTGINTGAIKKAGMLITLSVLLLNKPWPIFFGISF